MIDNRNVSIIVDANGGYIAIINDKKFRGLTLITIKKKRAARLSNKAVR